MMLSLKVFMVAEGGGEDGVGAGALVLGLFEKVFF